VKRRDIVLFLGPPGSGKGTLSQLCVKRLNWKQLSTGNLCRTHIAQATPLGKEIDFAIKSGKLIADSLIIGMVEEWLESADPVCTIIFDGFPRTVPQAQALHDLVEAREDLSLSLVLLAIPDQELVHRLLSRSICQNEECQQVYSVRHSTSLGPKKELTCDECESPLIRRSDDEAIAIAERLKIYREHEKGLLTFYQEKGHPIRKIEGVLTLEEVYNRFLHTAGHADV
jgi:adenylate kinase